MKFNKGDRVIFQGLDDKREATVVDGDSYGSLVAVQFDDNIGDDGYRYTWVYRESLALAPAEYKTGVEEAQALVYGDRNADYGHPYDDFERTAKMWSAIIGAEVTAKQAALCMAAVKISREVNRPKRDNLVDLAGYAEVALRIQRKIDGEEPN